MKTGVTPTEIDKINLYPLTKALIVKKTHVALMVRTQMEVRTLTISVLSYGKLKLAL